MIILGIETSCDETAVALISAKKNSQLVTLFSNTVTSSLELHAKTGGIIPEIAARQQIQYILPVIKEALRKANVRSLDIDAIAVTYGPGLIGSLLVGVETAKTLAYTWNKPIIPVNHLLGHIYANFISEISNFKFQISNSDANITFPVVALIVSGGHTDLLVFKEHGSWEWLGGTRDDAAGEAFDKIGRLLGLTYPAGPMIEKLAQKGNPNRFIFPRPIIDSDDFDFSFSGLKTAVLREVKATKQFNNTAIYDLCASVQQAIIDVLVAKTLKAAKEFKVKSILLGGGVAANEKLREQLKFKVLSPKSKVKLFAPAKSLCTDNAAMIAAAAFFSYKEVPWQKVTADPELHFN